MNERLDESKLEEWSKCFVMEKIHIFIYEREAIGKKRT